jgi:hypothetical protein
VCIVTGVLSALRGPAWMDNRQHSFAILLARIYGIDGFLKLADGCRLGVCGGSSRRGWVA